MNTDEERAAAAALAAFNLTGNGYVVEQSNRPQTIGYALVDSPVALAAWILDHDTDSYYKISLQPTPDCTRRGGTGGDIEGRQKLRSGCLLGVFGCVPAFDTYLPEGFWSR